MTQFTVRPHRLEPNTGCHSGCDAGPDPGTASGHGARVIVIRDRDAPPVDGLDPDRAFARGSPISGAPDLPECAGWYSRH